MRAGREGENGWGGEGEEKKGAWEGFDSWNELTK